MPPGSARRSSSAATPRIRGTSATASACSARCDELDHPFETLGAPGYPEGHADIDRARLLEVLREKQAHVSYMTTQMCFNPGAIVRWIAEMRRQGVTLAVHLGTPGVADLTKLMTISARIGIADSARYLKKNKRMVGHLLTPGKFGPDALLEGMAPALADPSAKIEALHLFTFNQVAATVEWQQRMLASARGRLNDRAARVPELGAVGRPPTAGHLLHVPHPGPRARLRSPQR